MKTAKLMSLCHNHLDNDIKTMKRVIFLAFVFMCVELWGHWHSNSLSLLADSVHLFVDVVSFLISILALYLSKKRASPNMSFGYHRIEIVGALFSISFLWVATFYLVIEAISRYKNPQTINRISFISVSSLGLVFHGINLLVLRKSQIKSECSDKQNLNIKAAYIHIIGDVIQSCGVFLTSIIIYFYPQMVIFDLIITMFFAGIVLITTCFLIRDGFNILIEKTPKEIDINAMKQSISNLDKVIMVENIHTWSLSINVFAVMLKVVSDYKTVAEIENIKANIRKEILKNSVKFQFINIELTQHDDKKYEITEENNQKIIEEI